MIRLHINVDHVATLRNARGTSYPDPVFAAQLCEQAGADGITMHLREDRRHIRDADVERARIALKTWINLEMAATSEMIEIAQRIHPDVITLVPERREERTTEGGLDVVSARTAVAEAAVMCRREGIKLSLFIEAAPAQIEASRELGAQQVELHTGHYAETQSPSERAAELERMTSAARLAQSYGLHVAAGHGLTQHNVGSIVRLPAVEELNIGHAVISDAVFVGLDVAVAAFRAAIDRAVAQADR